MTYIYALRDPRDARVFYVGKTVRPWKRMKNHLRSGMCEFLVADGFNPMLHILEQCQGEDWRDREKYWISEFKRTGHALSNRHPGGNSRSPGFSQPISEATKKKLSECMKGRPLHPAFIERQRLTDMKVLTEKAALANRGRKRPQDVIEKIRQSNKRTWESKALRNNAKEYGRVAAKNQWACMSPEERKAYVHRLHEWFRNLSPEEQSERQRQHAIKPRKKVPNGECL